jgi:hypothetical protein
MKSRLQRFEIAFTAWSELFRSFIRSVYGLIERG